MPRAPRISGIEMVRALKRGGWVVSRQSGSHAILRSPIGAARRITVPVHPGRTLKQKTFASILEQAGLTIEEFRGLL